MSKKSSVTAQRVAKHQVQFEEIQRRVNGKNSISAVSHHKAPGKSDARILKPQNAFVRRGKRSAASPQNLAKTSSGDTVTSKKRAA